MRRWLRTVLVGAVCASLLIAPGALARSSYSPGSPGIGDPYFPLDGNGGYDVAHYDLALRYQPSTRVLVGRATIRAVATKSLSRFDLDLRGLTVDAVRVAGRGAHWSRYRHELVITPAHGIAKGHAFTVVVAYHGVPHPVRDAEGLQEGFAPTDDGANAVGEPHGAATWFPVDDHPRDKASYTMRVTVPAGVTAVANGVLAGRRDHDALTTWTWAAREPMASYLATVSIGKFDLHAYTRDGIRYWDAIDPDLLTRVQPRTGTHFAYSQADDSAYKRLSRTISVPAGGADVSFWIQRDDEDGYDTTAVEARTVGQDDWTTLPDVNGHTRNDVFSACPYSLDLHPFLAHYWTATGETCTPHGTTGDWWGATGASNGYEHWDVDLSAYAGKDVEVSITAITDDSVTRPGDHVDDVVVSTGEGSTSFEPDGDTMDGWSASGAPAGSPGNARDWISSTSAQEPPTAGDYALRALAKQPRILAFLSHYLGRYPFSAAGGIVDDSTGVGYALENQTRPTYSKLFFTDQASSDDVVVHELTHQWTGDLLRVHSWKDIWLNEGFASYATWLWDQHEGRLTAAASARRYALIPAGDRFWHMKIAEPGTVRLFDTPVYYRGALTLQALRTKIGDRAFFRLLRAWVHQRAGRTVTTPEFIALAEHVSGRSLHRFFQVWLYTAKKPAGLPSARSGARVSERSGPGARRR
ncbi:MAG: M1 family aminopeptidase [Marmoricola sp.]